MATTLLPHPLYLPEILNIIFSYLDDQSLARCLPVSRLWFDCAVQWLYREMSIVDLLKLTESGRQEGGPKLGQFNLTAQDALQLSKYAAHIVTLSCTCFEYKNKEARHEWKSAGRSFALVPVDPLDQFSSLIRQWHALVVRAPHLLPTPTKPGFPITLQDLFPKLTGLRGGFGLEDDLGAITYLDFTLPLDTPSAFLGGLTYPLQSAYTFSVERELRGTELVLRAQKMYAILSGFEPYFFFFLRRSETLRELELAMLWNARENAELDWRAVWQEEESVEYPPRLCKLRKLVFRSTRPAEYFLRLVDADMLGPVLPELEQLFFGVEREVEVEEWDMSGSEDGDGVFHPFTIDDDDEDMSDVDGALGPGEDGADEGEMTTDTDSDTDSESDESGETEGSGDGEEEDGDESMSGSGDDGASWQTEDEIQVDGSDVAAAEALFAAQLLPGRLPGYFEPEYKPPSALRFSTQMKDGVVLHRLLAAVARACPGLKVVGWDGRASVRLGPAYAAATEEGRLEILEREARRMMDAR